MLLGAITFTAPFTIPALYPRKAPVRKTLGKSNKGFRFRLR